MTQNKDKPYFWTLVPMKIKVTTFGIAKEQRDIVNWAIKTVDALVWGGQMNKKVKHIRILKNSSGRKKDPPIFRGLINVYSPKTKTCELHIGSLIEMGEDTDTNLAWSICHDLSHAFDVCYKNLIFNTKDNTLKYLNKSYRLDKVANTFLSEEYRKLQNFRGTTYYQAHDLYEPWETRPLFAADVCMAEYRRGNLCPNLVEAG